MTGAGCTANRRISRACWLLPLASIIVTTGYGIGTGRLGRTQPVDHREYVMAATRLLRHATMTSSLLAEGSGDADTRPSNLMPPVYVALVAGVYRTFGVEQTTSSYVLQAINILAIAAAVGLIVVTASTLGGPRSAWLAGGIAVIHPTLTHYTVVLWDTSLFTFAVALCLWIATSWPESRSGSVSWLLFGLLLGAVALLNPALTIAYPLLILWPASRTFGWRFRPLAKASLLAVSGWLIAITPWTIRNYHHFGSLSYLRGGFYVDAWLGFCPEADGKPSEAYDRWFPLKDAREQQRVNELGEQGFAMERRQRVWAAVRQEPARALRLVLKRTVDYWTGNAYSLRLWEHGGRSLSHLFGVLFLSVESLLLAASMVFSRNRRTVWWLAGMAILFSLPYCLTHVMMRYRAPMEPIVVVAVGMLLSAANNRGSAKSRSSGAFTER